MKKLYFYSKCDFKEVAIPEWNNYETMISTAKDIKAILDEGKDDYKTLKNIKETIEAVQGYYEDLQKKRGKNRVEGAFTYWHNLDMLKLDVNMAMWYYEEDKRGYFDDGKYYNNKDFFNKQMTRINTKLRDLTRGVVYYRSDETDWEDKFFHTTDPTQDEYEYNGRVYYLWDGWHSSKAVMQEMADKKMN